MSYYFTDDENKKKEPQKKEIDPREYQRIYTDDVDPYLNPKNKTKLNG